MISDQCRYRRVVQLAIMHDVLRRAGPDGDADTRQNRENRVVPQSICLDARTPVADSCVWLARDFITHDDDGKRSLPFARQHVLFALHDAAKRVLQTDRNRAGDLDEEDSNILARIEYQRALHYFVCFRLSASSTATY